MSEEEPRQERTRERQVVQMSEDDWMQMARNAIKMAAKVKDPVQQRTLIEAAQFFSDQAQRLNEISRLEEGL